MSLVVLVSAGAAIGLLAFFAGLIVGRLSARTKLSEADRRYETLRREFDSVAAVNTRLLTRIKPEQATHADANALDRFRELQDVAKRCLHQTLAQHNATALRPIVISRDGGNLLEALSDIPELSFSQDAGEDAGVRVWLRRVFETDIQRRAERKPLVPDEVLALERERSLWVVLAKERR